jgi:S-layer homology domain
MAESTFINKLKRFCVWAGLVVWALASVIGLGVIGFQWWQLNDLKSKVMDLEAKVLAQPVADGNAAASAVAGVPLSSGALPGGTDSLAGFSDIAEVNSQKYINDLVAIGFFNDMGLSGQFYPFNGITRGEFAFWIFKARNLIHKDQPKTQIRIANPNTPPYFKDVPSTHPYYKYIQSLAENGFSVGYGDGTFRPDKVLTREEMIGMKVAVDDKAREPADPVNYNKKFTDHTQIDRRFVNYVYFDEFGYCMDHFARIYGETNLYKPKQPVLRHEAAVAVWRSGCKDAVE